MKRLLCLLGMSVLCAFANPDPVVKAKFDDFYVDNIGNIYTVKEDELTKYLPSGKLFTRYSNLQLGTITSVDVTNPLKLLVYYRDFQQIVFLDNQLSVNSDAVALEKLGYEQTELACVSANNGFWIYNKQNNELLRFDESSRKISSTGNIKQVLRQELKPNFMMEHNGFLYLNSPENGIYVFDIFGAFARFIPIAGLRDFQVADKILYYQKDTSFCSYNMQLLETSCEPVRSAGARVRWAPTAIYKGLHDTISKGL